MHVYNVQCILTCIRIQLPLLVAYFKFKATAKLRPVTYVACQNEYSVLIETPVKTGFVIHVPISTKHRKNQRMASVTVTVLHLNLCVLNEN